MANTSIEWTDDTWNPVTGCTKVSPGCAHCYAETVAHRFWKGRAFTDVECREDRLDQPLRWRKPRRVFVNSMSDLFHEDVPDEFIRQCLCVMAIARRHTFQVLTKRAERMRAFMLEIHDAPDAFLWAWAREYEREDGASVDCPRDEAWPLPNVWLGVSVENQQMADERIPLLLQTPAAVRFLSCEPLLEAIDLTAWNGHDTFGCRWLGSLDAVIGWVIVGGESGSQARPFDVAWGRALRDQCRTASVPCFVKQLGSRPYALSPHREGWGAGVRFARRDPDGCAHLFDVHLHDRKGGDMSEWPDDLRVREWPA